MSFSHHRVIPMLVARAMVGPVVISVFVLGAASVLAAPPPESCAFGGFSESAAGLPEQAVEAWGATVLIHVKALVQRLPGQAKLQSRRGAGVVLRVLGDSGGRSATAHVVINAHALWFGESDSWISVGFSGVEDPDVQIWSHKVKVLAVNRTRDLAFLEVKVPKRAAKLEPRFADPACFDWMSSGVVSIGWPDLTRRTVWWNERPANAAKKIKRFSLGGFRHALGDYRLASSDGIAMDRVKSVIHDSDVLPGSSGGPVINAAGEIVGINTLVLGSRENVQHRLYAGPDAVAPSEGCPNLAISVSEIAAEYSRLVGGEIDVRRCVVPVAATDEPVLARVGARAGAGFPAP